jgi:hypothetical protein
MYAIAVRIRVDKIMNSGPTVDEGNDRLEKCDSESYGQATRGVYFARPVQILESNKNQP